MAELLVWRLLLTRKMLSTLPICLPLQRVQGGCRAQHSAVHDAHHNHDLCSGWDLFRSEHSQPDHRLHTPGGAVPSCELRLLRRSRSGRCAHMPVHSHYPQRTMLHLHAARTRLLPVPNHPGAFSGSDRGALKFDNRPLLLCGRKPQCVSSSQPSRATAQALAPIAACRIRL